MLLRWLMSLRTMRGKKANVRSAIRTVVKVQDLHLLL
jgi:hypothetical protein